MARRKSQKRATKRTSFKRRKSASNKKKFANPDGKPPIQKDRGVAEFPTKISGFQRIQNFLLNNKDKVGAGLGGILAVAAGQGIYSRVKQREIKDELFDKIDKLPADKKALLINLLFAVPGSGSVISPIEADKVKSTLFDGYLRMIMDMRIVDDKIPFSDIEKYISEFYDKQTLCLLKSFPEEQRQFLERAFSNRKGDEIKFQMRRKGVKTMPETQPVSEQTTAQIS